MIRVTRGTIKSGGAYFDTGALLDLPPEEERRLLDLKVAEEISAAPNLEEIELQSLEANSELDSDEVAAAVVSAADPDPAEPQPAAKHAPKAKKKA